MSEKITVGPFPSPSQQPTVRASAPVAMEFDGRSFIMPLNNPLIVPLLYMAAQARRGDALAIALLTACNCTICDNNQKPYWPPEQSNQPAIVTKTI